MFEESLKTLHRPGRVTILGLTGQAGAGKSNHIAPIIAREADRLGIKSQILGLDAFFILSSRGRKEWIAQGWEISEAEGLRRENQINWWNFQLAEQGLLGLRQGNPLHLTNVYNRKDKGELTGEIRIEPPTDGMLVVFDGVAIAHLEGVDYLWYVHAPGEVRQGRLFNRDGDRRSLSADAQGRWEVTERFERAYFPKHWQRITLFILNAHNNGSGPGPYIYPENLSHETCLQPALALEGQT